MGIRQSRPGPAEPDPVSTGGGRGTTMTTTGIGASIEVAADGAVSALMSSTSRQWAAAVDHRFVRELFAGSIDDAVMRDYLVQDYQFFESFLSMLGACVAHADELEAKLRFAPILGIARVDWVLGDAGVHRQRPGASLRSRRRGVSETARRRDLDGESVCPHARGDLLI